MRVVLCVVGLLGLLTACSGSGSSSASAPHLRSGPWHGALLVGTDHHRLPLTLTVLPDSAGHPRAVLDNGGESFRLTEFTPGPGDSLTVRLHMFDAALVGHVTDQTFSGYWQKFDAKKPYRVPFRLVAGSAPRRPAKPAVDFAGTWAVTFRDPADSSSYPAVGVFKQQGNAVTGTFLTETGDYRYLRGEARRDTLRLYTFDGAHGYAFEAQWQPDGTLRGEFRAGPTGYETWTAHRDPHARLADADTLNGLKAGHDRLTFTFPDLRGRPVSLQDARFRGKGVVVQLLGSWCPNCMDETAYLAPAYQRLRAQGVEVVGLAYERVRDTAVVHPRLRRLRQRFGIEYPLLLAGLSNKDSAAATLPALRGVVAFPTTIFIGRDGKVKKVHTGFSGPGTGKYYDEWKAEFEETVKHL